MTADDPDAALVRRSLAGHADAQRELVERYRETVYRLARSATGDPDEALDITQEAFIAAFGALNRFDPGRSFKAWISAITLNKCRDWARRRAVRRFIGLPMPEQAAQWIADDAPSAQTLAADRAELAATARAIAKLPARSQRCPDPLHSRRAKPAGDRNDTGHQRKGGRDTSWEGAEKTSGNFEG